jgi:plastocyanin
MKKNFFFLVFTLYSIIVSGTTITITNSGSTFSPASVTINSGDSVNFVLASIHNAVEVSQATWDANGTTPLSGGFSTAFGGDTVLPAALTLGTHYYVCAAHGSSGMKGVIIVQDPATSIYNLQVDKNNIAIYPNPTSGNFTLVVSDFKNEEMQVRITNATGEEVYTLQKEKVNRTYSKEISLQNISKGIYFVQIKTRESTLVKKIVVNP